MSTHISGLTLGAADSRTDDELCTELEAAAKAWLLANRAREIGAALHQQALSARFGYAHARTAAEVVEEWHEDARGGTWSTVGTIRVHLYTDTDGTRYLAFPSGGDFFVQTRDTGRFGADCSYHDATDEQLAEMTFEEWKGRLATWDRLIPSGRYSIDGRTVTATVSETDPLVPDFTDAEAIAEARVHAVADHLIDAPFDMSQMMSEFRLRVRSAHRAVDTHRHLFGQPTVEDPAGGFDPEATPILRQTVNVEYARVTAEGED